MKKVVKNAVLITLALLLTHANALFAQNVGINEDGSEPDNRAILDVKSSSKGVILPRLSDTERDALYRDVPFGMMIFNTTDSALQIFMDTAWYNLSIGTAETALKPLTDIDGNTYDVVQIGDQVWMAENLKTTKYNNGTSIDLVTDNTTWQNNTTGAYCWYDNDQAQYAETYGALYNWHAVNTGNLCPDGWHVPTDEEWKTLEMELGMSQADADGTNLRGNNEGSKLAGNAALWSDGNLENDSEFGSSGFSALPVGYRYNNGSFLVVGDNGFWWSSTESSSSNAWYRYLNYGNSGVYRYNNYKENGFSVRCLRD